MLFFKAIGTVTAHLVGKILAGRFSVVVSDLRALTLNESIATLLIGHIEVARVLNRRETHGLTKRYPKLAYKYHDPYLTKRLSQKARRSILIFHYQYVTTHTVKTFHERILGDGFVLWKETTNGDILSISLLYHSWSDVLGELCLLFNKNNTPLYGLSFTIVPGHLLDCVADPILLIGRVQGVREQAEAIKAATRACQYVPLPHLLLVAAQSIASALAIGAIGGVSNEELLGKPRCDDDTFFFNYDTFWETFSGKKNSVGIYEIPVPFHEKPIEEIKAGGRRRTRLKRQFKRKIASSVKAAFSEVLGAQKGL